MSLADRGLLVRRGLRFQMLGQGHDDLGRRSPLESLLLGVPPRVGLMGPAHQSGRGQERCAQSVTAFVSISTPWLGQDEAQRAVGQTTYVLPAWLDLAPRSEFLESLHERGLPPRSTFALFFGYRGGLSTILTGSSDKTVTLRSMLDQGAQAEASTVRGFEEDHDSILVSEAVAQALNRTLESAVPAR